jgi:major membrane immunogen (membrane-anchored lipoprotein)
MDDPKQTKPMQPDPNAQPMPGTPMGDNAKTKPNVNKNEQLAKGNDPGEAKSNSNSQGNAKPNPDSKEPSPAGANPGQGATADQNRGAATDQAAEERGKMADPNQEFANRAGNLQLEDFKKQVTPEMLQKHGITEEQWKQYLENLAKHKDQPPNAADNKNDTVGGNRAGSSNVNQGPRKIETDPNAKAGDFSGGPGSAPPEYQDAAGRFTKIISEGKKPPKK